MPCKDFVITLYITIWICCCISIFCQNDLTIGSMTTDCETFRVHYIDEATNYTISWLNQKPTSYCKLNFKGRGTDEGIYDKYKICVYSISFTVLDCDTVIKLYFERNPPEKVYDCKNEPDTSAVCGEEDKYFTLSLESKNEYANLNIYPSRFMFLVTAVKTYDASVDQDAKPSFLLIIIGLVVGLVVLLLTICVVVNIVRRKRTKKLTQQLNEDTHNRTETDCSRPALLSQPTAPPLADIDISESTRGRRHREPRGNRRRHRDEIAHESRGAERDPREHRGNNDHSDTSYGSRGHDRHRGPRGHRHREHRPEPTPRFDVMAYNDPPPSYEMVMKAEAEKIS